MRNQTELIVLDLHAFFFNNYKNKVYKNNQAEICPKN